VIAGRSLLLDTHVVIWMAKRPDRLPRSLSKAIEAVETRLVSHVTAWEIQIKWEKYGTRFGFSLDQFEEALKAFSCTELPIEYGDIRGLSEMRFFHPDPFDRLLMSQAARRAIYFATLDPDIVRTSQTTKQFSVFTDGTRS
jgi:PIN domain nuclease of toxin-antitoxin system